MDLFSGEPYLCDFGAPIEGCPDEPTCLGPGGTQVSARRLYDYDVWSTRKYVQDALKLLFPDRAQEIDDKVDPGEYGAESQRIRWLCCFIFMIEVMNELALIMNMTCLLYAIPSTAEPWLIEVPNTNSEAELDEGNDVEIKIRIAGMPRAWKVLNVVIMLFPKILLWYLTAEVGVTYLMETSAIEDMIVNAIALAFILQVDETICVNLMNKSLLTMLSECDPYEWITGLDAQDRVRQQSEHEISLEVNRAETFFQGVTLLVPLRLMLATALTGLFIMNYYWKRCKWMSDGGWWASKDVFLPTSTRYSVLNVLFPSFYPLEYQEEPVWTLSSEG